MDDEGAVMFGYGCVGIATVAQSSSIDALIFRCAATSDTVPYLPSYHSVTSKLHRAEIRGDG